MFESASFHSGFLAMSTSNLIENSIYPLLFCRYIAICERKRQVKIGKMVEVPRNNKGEKYEAN